MAVPYAGYVRTKSRQQAQDERRWGQDRFEGGQDSDTPPVKIGANELARAVNVVCYPDRVEGGYGRVLASDERLPGSGVRHDLKQHTVTGRWLLHRGNKLWLSAGRKQRQWSEVTTIGPDGSLSASGSFTDGSAPVSGAAAAYLSNMVVAGATPGQDFNIEMVDVAGPSVQVSLLSGLTLVARGTLLLSAQPSSLELDDQGGSGISATVDVDGYTMGNECIGTAEVSESEVSFTLRGLTLENTDDWELWWKVDATNVFFSHVLFYKDSAMTSLVASSEEFPANIATNISVTSENDSGISGTFTWPEVDLIAGVYNGAPTTFSPEEISIDSDSFISSFNETAFVVFVRGVRKTIYVNQSIDKYWFLSTPYGYGSIQLYAGAPDNKAYQYRYLYTFSRIVDVVTQEPSYSANRTTGLLQLEGPSNLSSLDLDVRTDYTSASATAPISPTGPQQLVFSGPTVDDARANAAAYITHISIYRTLDVGVNGAVNNPEIYVWVADVPIYSISYEDTTTDAVLQNRFSGGALSGENFALRSRFYREMDRGIGAIRPDFMATATPQGTKITYCDVAVNPRFIGYYFPGSQYNLTQDPISDIVSTKELFVYLCPYSTYTSIAQIAVDTGIQGISYIPVMQNFNRSSQNVGVKYGQRTFPVTDSSFVSLCSDGTVRVYSGTFWGEALDGNQVHKLVELAQIGAVLLYFRDVLYMWYTTDATATVTDKCLRYGAGGQSGNGWTPVERDNWVWPPVGGGMAAVWEQDDASFRMIAIDDTEDVAFAIEDLPPLRQYEDDLVEDGEAIEGTDSLANLNFPGWETSTLYGIIRAVDGGVVVQFFQSEDDRSNNINAVGTTDTLTEPADDVTIMGTIPGTVDVLSITPVEFTVVPGVRVSGKSQISSPLRIRALAATQQQFICFHQESYAFFRAVYGMPMPVVAAAWYADDVLVPASVQSSVPPGGDIQSYAQVRGRTIQFELEPQSSGWQLTGINSKYQTQDMRSANGPWNSAEAALQRELAQGLFVWVLGVTALINRADAFYPRFSDPVPALFPGPFGRIGGQYFTEASSLALERQVTTYSMLFWVKEPVAGVDAAPIALLDDQDDPVLYVMFTDSTHINIGSFEYEVPETDEWVCYCVTRDDSAFNTYRNGVLLGTGVLSPGTDVAVASVRIGAQLLYDIRTYSAALSSDAVAYYYNHLNQTPP